MKKILSIAMLLTILILTLLFVGCRQADRVGHNISKEADNFNVLRRLTVINSRTDKPVFELTGVFALSNNGSEELEITCQTGPNSYKKHFVYINKEWTMYVVEDVSGANVSPYHYEIKFLPEAIIPFSFEVGDENVYYDDSVEQ